MQRLHDNIYKDHSGYIKYKLCRSSNIYTTRGSYKASEKKVKELREKWDEHNE